MKKDLLDILIKERSDITAIANPDNQPENFESDINRIVKLHKLNSDEIEYLADGLFIEYSKLVNDSNSVLRKDIFMEKYLYTRAIKVLSIIETFKENLKPQKKHAESKTNIEKLIQWKGNTTQLVLLFDELHHAGKLKLGVEVNSLIVEHFCDTNGKPFKRANLSNARQSNKDKKIEQIKGAEVIKSIVNKVK